MDLIAGSVALAVAAIGAGVDMVNIKHIKELREMQDAIAREQKVCGFCIAAVCAAVCFEGWHTDHKLKSNQLDFANEITVVNNRINQVETRTEQNANSIAAIKKALNL